MGGGSNRQELWFLLMSACIRGLANSIINENIFGEIEKHFLKKFWWSFSEGRITNI